MKLNTSNYYVWAPSIRLALQYVPHGIEYLEGKYKKGHKKWDPEYDSQLLRCVRRTCDRSTGEQIINYVLLRDMNENTHHVE